MSVSLSTVRGKLNTILGDIISGTTTAEGSTDKTSLIDSTLAWYPDDYFIDYSVYLTVTNQEKKVKSFISPSGTLVVASAFSAQVASGVAYELYRFSASDKLLAINKALRDAYPSFYSYVRNETLWGQNKYGEEETEFDKFKYTIPSGFYDFPDQIWLREGYIGTHTGDDAALVLTDADMDWETNELAGETIRNKTDGSSGTVTSNTATTVTATLAGGTDNKWDEDDEYIVPKPNRKPVRFYDYKPLQTSSGWEFYADIHQAYSIILIGKQVLTAFTTDASITEINDSQAEILVLKAAANLFRMYATKIDVQDAGRFKALADEYAHEFYVLVERHRMPPFFPRLHIDWEWSQ